MVLVDEMLAVKDEEVDTLDGHTPTSLGTVMEISPHYSRTSLQRNPYEFDAMEINEVSGHGFGPKKGEASQHFPKSDSPRLSSGGGGNGGGGSGGGGSGKNGVSGNNGNNVGSGGGSGSGSNNSGNNSGSNGGSIHSSRCASRRSSHYFGEDDDRMGLHYLLANPTQWMEYFYPKQK